MSKNSTTCTDLTHNITFNDLKRGVPEVKSQRVKLSNLCRSCFAQHRDRVFQRGILIIQYARLFR